MIVIPPDTADLPTLLHSLLTPFLHFPPSAISLSGVSPDFEAGTINLTHATPRAKLTPALPTGEAARVRHAFSIARLSLLAHPFGTRDRPLTVDLAASGVRLEIVETRTGQTALRLAGGEGTARASLDKAVLRSVFLAEASQAAGRQGITIQDVTATFRSAGPRSLAAEIIVKAKKSILPAATVRITGQLSIDDQLTGRVHGLSVNGDGIGGSVAAGFIRPRLTQLEGQGRSLLALPLDAVRIKDVRIREGAAAITVEIDFAS